jgi:hypothetical protein
MRRVLYVLVAAALVVSVASAYAQKGRDLSKLRPCEIVTGKDVASIAKGKLMSDPLGGSSACSYLIELSNGQVESYGLSFQPAAAVEATLKVQSPAERGERVSGLWDEAYASKRFMASGLSLVALHRGDMALEVTGERKDVLIAVAKLAISRLK